jgi:Tetratricopeptide repeat
MVIGFYYSRAYDQAVEAAEHLIRSFPEYPPSYRWLAAAYGQLGRTAEAKEALGKALAIAPVPFEPFGRRTRRGVGQRISPTCSKACARPDCRRSEAPNSHSRC